MSQKIATSFFSRGRLSKLQGRATWRVRVLIERESGEKIWEISEPCHRWIDARREFDYWERRGFQVEII